MILKIAAIIMLTTLAFVLLKKDRAEFAFVIELCVTAGILIILFPSIESLIDSFSDMSDHMNLDTVFIRILIKCSGIAIVSKLICELCKDAGENALCAKFELAAKVFILTTALPVFQALFNLIRELLENMI